MNELVEKKTGVVRLGNGVVLPCDATINTDDTFDTELMATIGETMYLLLPKAYEEIPCDDGFGTTLGKMIIDETCIYKVVISRIVYATGCGLCLDGITENGDKKGAVQELFYRTYDEALQGIDTINQFYLKNPKGDWISDCKEYISFPYQYMLTFPLKPQDILLEDNMHYVANRVIAYIYPDYATVEYQGHDDASYKNGREVHSSHEYAGVKNQYKIVKLIERQPQIIDV